VLNAWHESVTNGTPYEQEERHRRADGTYRWFLARGVPLRDGEGRIVRWYGTNTDIEDRKRAEEELRLLSGQILRSQDEERRRIARDLHDSTGQDLVALATMLGRLRSAIPAGDRKSRRLLSECKSLADRCIREVRTLSYVLHPPVLDHAGLGVAIRDYVKGFIDRTGIHVELDLSPGLGRMTRDVELTLFRVMQEGLINIQRHSGSQRAEIRINRNSDLTLEISDIGHGLYTNVQRGRVKPGFEVGVGIPSMHERVKLIGGRLEIDSSSQGTTVRVMVPLSGERNHEKTAHSDS
jgi:two-component system, NarL family, sensor kinase